jgi:glutathione peroxidase
MSTSVTEISVRTIDGRETTLGAYKGKVALVVNVASKCGLTPQYEGLQKLYAKYRDRGLVVLGFPANDFAGQEPGTNDEIKGFCTLNYGVDFPMFEKIVVTGEGKHPLYKALTAAQPKPVAENPGEFRKKLIGFGLPVTSEPEVLWNFEKFLVGKDGRVVGRFSPETTPESPALTAAIEAELAK